MSFGKMEGIELGGREINGYS